MSLRMHYTIPWEGLWFSEVVNGESLGSVAASQCLEALKRDAGGSCDKLQQTQTLFVVKHADSLPEPQHHLVSGVVT